MRKIGFLLVVLLGLALTAAACTSGDSGGGSSGSGGSGGVTVVGTEFAFEPASIEASVGEEVTITLKNEGTIPHDLTIEGFGVETGVIAAGTSKTITFTPDQAGQFRFICTVPGHADAGMVGEITVQ